MGVWATSRDASMLTRTTTAMLEDLRDASNQAVWDELDGRFRPVLVGFARRLGLAAEDAADAAQETLTEFVRSYREGDYDRSRGSLHSWLLGIARNCIRRQHAAARQQQGQRGASALDAMPAEDTWATLWQAECERGILSDALQQLREQSRFDERTIRAFERVAFDEQPPSSVAEELGLTLNEVYLAKHRCLKKLRACVEAMRTAYELSA